MCCALFRKRSYCAVSSSVEIRKTIYCEEREEESVANPLFVLLLWISASLWKSF